MNESINLIEILKDAPEGTKLWSPICGECEFLYINYEKGEDYEIPLIHTHTIKEYVSGRSMVYYADFLEDGQLEFCNSEDGECMLFPSKDNRDWSTFKAPWKHKHFEPFQKVLISSLVDTFPCKEIWVPVLYGYYDEETKAHILTNGSSRDDNGIIPYEGNEDKLGKPVEK